MKKTSIISVIFVVGILVLLKMFGVGSSMIRISDPLTNNILLNGAIIAVVIFGIVQFKKNK